MLVIFTLAFRWHFQWVSGKMSLGKAQKKLSWIFFCLCVTNKCSKYKIFFIFFTGEFSWRGSIPTSNISLRNIPTLSSSRWTSFTFRWPCSCWSLDLSIPYQSSTYLWFETKKLTNTHMYAHIGLLRQYVISILKAQWSLDC